MYYRHNRFLSYNNSFQMAVWFSCVLVNTFVDISWCPYVLKKVFQIAACYHWSLKLDKRIFLLLITLKKFRTLLLMTMRILRPHASMAYTLLQVCVECFLFQYIAYICVYVWHVVEKYYNNHSWFYWLASPFYTASLI